MRYKKVILFGSTGMVGSAISRQLEKDSELILLKPTSEQVDCTCQAEVSDFVSKNSDTDLIIVAAAKVGGIIANRDNQSGFLVENMFIGLNIIQAANDNAIENLLFLGSSCIYPKFTKQPIREDQLLTGLVEPTNEGYALAKISCMKACEYISREYKRNYMAVMPTSIYGKNDNYHPTLSHVIPAMIRKFHEAKIKGENEVILWGTGSPLREFLYVDDLAEAIVYVLRYTDSSIGLINIGSGLEVSIKELAENVSAVVGFDGSIKWDETKPDGSPRKLLDSTKIRSIGWTPKNNLVSGLKLAYNDFLAREVHK